MSRPAAAIFDGDIEFVHVEAEGEAGLGVEGGGGGVADSDDGNQNPLGDEANQLPVGAVFGLGGQHANGHDD